MRPCGGSLLNDRRPSLIRWRGFELIE